MAHDTTTPVLDQEAFRGRDDDVALNSGTFNGGGGLNGNWSQDVDVNFRCRFEMQETAGGEMKNKAYNLQYNLAGGGWNDVSGTSPIQWASSGQYTDTDVTTQVIGDGSFVAGEGCSGDATTAAITLLSQSTEIEFCLQIDSAQVTNGQTFQLRLYNSTDAAPLDGYTNTPTITVVEPTYVNETLDLRWDILNDVTETLDLRWDILNDVTETLDLRWDILNDVTETVDLRYDILNDVTETLDLRWDILNDVAETLDFRWDILNDVTEALDLRYDILNDVAETLDLRWDILNNVAETLDLRYDVLNNVAETLDLRYDILSSAPPGTIPRVYGTAGNLGGAIEATAPASDLLNELFSDVPEASRVAGSVTYGCVYIKNDGATGWTNIRAWIEEQGDDVIAVGQGTSGIGGTEQTIADDTTAPIGVTFFDTAVSYATGMPVPNLGSEQHFALWYRRTVVGGTAKGREVGINLMFDGDQTETGDSPSIAADGGWRSRYNRGRIVSRGPWLIWADASEITVWMALNEDGDACVRVRNADGAIVSEADSFIVTHGKVTVTGLAPSKTYDYSVVLDGAEVDGPDRFMTLPTAGSPGRVNVIVETDHHNRFAGYESVAELVDDNPDIPRLSVICGDFELTQGVTGFSGTDYDDKDANRAAWIDARTNADSKASLSPFQDADQQLAFRRRVPYLITWDDWDAFGNNLGGVANPLRVLNRTGLWREFHRADWADGTAVYHYRLICDCPFIFLDSRTFRTQTPGSLPLGAVLPEDFDPTTAVAFGQDQMDWLFSVLTTYASAPFKFLFDGGTWMDNYSQASTFGPGRRDSVGIYHRNERNTIVEWLRDNPDAARGLMLLTGDDHSPAAARPGSWKREYRNGFDDEEAVADRVKRPFLEIKPTPFGAVPGDLDDPWDLSPWRLFTREDTNLYMASIELNTSRNPAHASVQIRRIEAGMPVVYKVTGSDGNWYAPEDPKGGYTGQGGLGTVWTPEVVS